MKSNRLDLAYLPKFLIFPSLFIITSGFIYYYSYHLYSLRQELLNNGINIHGTIINKYITGKKKQNKKYYIEYRYYYNSEFHENESRIYYNNWETIKTKDTIRILVDPNNPDNSQYNSSPVFPKSDDYIVLATVLLLIGIAIASSPFIIMLFDIIKQGNYLIINRRSH